MDFMDFVRAVAIGCAWAGSFFTIMAIIFPLFPLPLLFDAYFYSRNYSASKFKKNNLNGIKWYERSAKAMRTVAIIFWLFILGLYLYSLETILGWYMDLKGRDFWTLYPVAASLPSIWFLRKSFKAWYRTYFYRELQLEANQNPSSSKPISQQFLENKY
jgi:hypothetical protein